MRNFVVEEVKMTNSEGHIFPLQDELNQANNTGYSRTSILRSNPRVRRERSTSFVSHMMGFA